MSKKMSIVMLVVLVSSMALSACKTPEVEPVVEEAEEVVEEVEESAEEVAEEVSEESEEVAEEVEEAVEEEPEAVGVKLSELDGVTIKFWHVWGEEKEEAFLSVVEQFNQTNEHGITVVAENQGGYSDLEDNFNAAIQSGDVPAVLVGYPNALAAWYDVDAIADLNPYFNDPVAGFTEEEKADFYQSALEGGVLAEGARIGLPLSQSINVLFYNKTWAEELGFENAPQTAAELKEQACAAAEANNNDDNPDNDGTGGLVMYAGASNVFSWIFAYGDDGLTEDGTAYDFTSEAVKEVATIWKEMWDEGCAFPTESYPNPEFATRQALFTMSSSAGVYYQEAAFDAEDATDDEWTLIPFVGPDGNKAVDAYGQYLGVVNTTPAKKLAAWYFLKYFTSPEAQAEWIRASGYFSVRKSTSDLLEEYKENNPKWVTALDLVQYGHSEPNDASWSSVRRAVGDAFYEILQSAMEDIDSILENLNETAAETKAEYE